VRGGAADTAAEPGKALRARSRAPPPSHSCRALVGEGAERRRSEEDKKRRRLLPQVALGFMEMAGGYEK
jgi:hypothetical protein